MDTVNFLEELSVEEMQQIDGGFLVFGLTILGGVLIACELYDWGYEYASRHYERA